MKTKTQKQWFEKFYDFMSNFIFGGKRTVLALIILISLNIHGQHLKQKEEIKSSWIVNNYDNDLNVASIGLKTGQIYIKGDTIKAIKQLFAFIKQVTDENKQKTICINKAVNFTNTVPDYLTKTKEWKDYQIELKKQGYKSITKKQKR